MLGFIDLAPRNTEHHGTPSEDVACWLDAIRERTNVDVLETPPGLMAATAGVTAESSANHLHCLVEGPQSIAFIQAFGTRSGLRDIQSRRHIIAQGAIRGSLASDWPAGLNTDFACAVYSPANKALYVITDKLGIVPAYTLRQGHALFYSTAMWPLRLLPRFDDTVDWRAIGEELFFGQPNADRTIFAAIRRQVGGTITRYSAKASPSTFTYYRLADAYRASDPARVPTRLAEAFSAAVADRLGDESTVFANLSGGLDSRTVVAALAAQGRKVHSVNFQPAGTLDAALSQAFADLNGHSHHHLPVPGLHYPNWSFLNRQFLDSDAGEAVRQTSTIWTGDGGGLTIGFVHMRRQLLERLRQTPLSDLAGAIPAEQPSARLFRHGRYDELRRQALSGLQEFFDSLGTLDNDARYYCHMIVNHVPRLFDEHFETAHIHRLSLAMPFLDTRAIEPVLSADLPGASEHRLYLQVARLISPAILAVPWQAYPGHSPCPLPLPASSRNQWSRPDPAATRLMTKARRRERLRILRSTLWRRALRPEMVACYWLADLLGVITSQGSGRASARILHRYQFDGRLAAPGGLSPPQ